ncbi:MAG: tetratricopeptide repeat protein, partial [Deltaproteobacteria bacterium]|nr:tetratricopeptide repeat protein [Deltaproteobacteria bacterium]
HALTQEVAYNSLLIERRKVLHERTAQVIEVIYHSRLEDHYGELANHYTRSSNTQKAVEYLQQAGQQAVQRSAYAEAISQLTAALELLKTLPDTPERIQRELTLQLTLGPALMATRGYTAPEVEQVYTRARELCQQVGETPQLFPVLFGLRTFYIIRAEHQLARELSEQLLSLARRMHDPLLLLQAHIGLGSSLFLLGEVAMAQTHFEQATALYDPQQHRSALYLGLANPGSGISTWLAWTLWFLGYPDQALQQNQRALTLAHELARPFNLAAVLSFAVGFHQLRREGRATQERAEALITLSTDQGFAQYAAQGTIRRGWALVEQGQAEAGVAQIRQGLAAHRATGAENARPHYLALLAEGYEKVGQAEEGLNTLVEALATVDKTGERYYEAELYRLKGKLVLQSGVRGPASENPNTQHPAPSTQAEAEAEACFHKAIEIAQRQQAKSWELRATVSLARLWQHQGKQHEARNTLSEIYNWFTEGFDTKDLQEAKVLLEELA